MRFFGDGFYRSVFWRTVRLGLVVTAVCILMGYPISFYLSRLKERRKSIGLKTLRHVAPSIRIAMTARPVLGFRHGPYMDEFVTRTLVWYALAVEACLTLLLLIVSTIRQRSDGSDR